MTDKPQPFTADDLAWGEGIVKRLHGVKGFEAWAELLVKERAALLSRPSEARDGALEPDPVICPECRGERRGSDGRLCKRCNGSAQFDRSKLKGGEVAPFEDSHALRPAPAPAVSGLAMRIKAYLDDAPLAAGGNAYELLREAANELAVSSPPAQATPSEEQITAAAKAMRAEAGTFKSPVHFYVDGEAMCRYEEANPEKDPYSDADDVEDWPLESWRILARAALSAAPAPAQGVPGWHRIDDPQNPPPKDGSDIILFNELWADTFGGCQIALWEHDRWRFQSGMMLDDMEDDAELDGVSADDYQPTHWMPVPASPPLPASPEDGR